MIDTMSVQNRANHRGEALNRREIEYLMFAFSQFHFPFFVSKNSNRVSSRICLRYQHNFWKLYVAKMKHLLDSEACLSTLSPKNGIRPRRSTQFMAIFRKQWCHPDILEYLRYYGADILFQRGSQNK